jgi:predicted  nucleic acid-binding Zn-ribbon protein
LANQEAFIVDQERELDKQKAALVNLQEIVTAFESNTADTEKSGVDDIASVSANVSDIADQLENDMAAQGQHLDEEISLINSRITSLEEQSAFIQNLLSDLRDQADEIQANSEIQMNSLRIVTDLEQAIPEIYEAIHETNQFIDEIDIEVLDLQDQSEFFNIALDQSTSAIELLDEAIGEVEDVQQELAGSSNYPVTVEQYKIYQSLTNGGSIGDEINDMPAPEGMLVPDCTGPDGTRECTDNLISAVEVDVYGSYESIQLAVSDLCQAAESAYGLERVHGNQWDSAAPSDETGALLDSGFISENEFNIIQWSLKNREFLKDSYVNC